MRRSGIYRIELGNGYFYIGSSVDLAKREHEHRANLRQGNHDNQVVQNCWNKYGVFDFTVLEVCEKSELLLQEQVWIDKNFSDPKNANLAPTAGSCLGVIHSAVSRANMSAARKGVPKSAETRANISAALKGRTLSAETRANMSAAAQNMSAEHRAKLSAAKIGRIHSAETKLKMSVNRQNMSAEHRANVSAANRRRWDKFRMEKLATEEIERGKKCS